MSGKLNQVTDSTFASEVLENSQLVVVDFWAEWCQPCKRLLSVLEEICEEYTGQVNFYSMNVDENPEVITEYMVRSIPTLYFFKEGLPLECLVGNQTKEKVKGVINKLLYN